MTLSQTDSQEPKDFLDNGKIILDNSWLKMANSKNYHHFFPKAYLRNAGVNNANSLMNITFVSDHLNKRKIGAKSPSDYVGDFRDQNPGINKALNSHFIDLDGFGVESDDYAVFLKSRASRIFNDLKSRISLKHHEPVNIDEEVVELIAGGEGQSVEFKSTLQYDLRTLEKNKKLEYVAIKTLAAFMNAGGGDLFIGIDDHGNALGLDKDISLLTKQSLDGFELKLISLMESYFGKSGIPRVSISFPHYDGVRICRVKASRSGVPVFTSFEGQEHFFVRMGATSQPLNRREQSDYQGDHW